MMLYRYCSKLGKNRFGSYAKSMHDAWIKDHNSVHQDWDKYFKGGTQTIVDKSGPQASEKQQDLAISAYLLIRYYKMRGHEIATLDPLSLKNFQQFGKIYVKHHLDADLKDAQVLNQSDLDISFKFPNSSIFTENMAKFLGQKQQWTIRQIQQKLKNIYSQKIGIQFMHISDPSQQTWIMHQFENISNIKYQKQQKIKILQQLTKIQVFNYFLNDKLKTSKRFGVEGLDSMISGLNALVQQAANTKIQYIGFGMAHRGRLNALANVFNKPLQKIFAQFQQNVQHDVVDWGISGDVKYHLGVTTQKHINGNKVRLSILPNPSHLQTVNPVVMGHVRAVSDSLATDQNGLTVIIHGDAALAGQGIVYQCLQMSYLPHYTNFGVIHIVANNQIGFTTTPAQARTGLYCTDVAKSIQAPIIHVNADQPELVNQAMKLAVRYRNKYHKDIFIDVIGYRRYGHNQQDQPSFTQPMMYQQISKKNNICSIYSQQLIKDNVVTDQQVKQLWQRQLSKISQAYSQSLHQTFDIKKWRIPTYHRVVNFSELGEIKRTGLGPQQLLPLGSILTHIPDSFNVNPQIKKIYETRKKSFQTGQGIDFATAQSLAFGSLLKQGFNIRLSGQDVQRGTFSHRHAVLVDQATQKKYIPLRNLLKPTQYQRMQIENSFLSQYAALGFQYGYSITNPNTLTIWQAQFGDFANGAQIIIDNYLSSGQSKWGLQSGLVLNLPHGLDGQGPQHSSSRVQRYLQLMSDSWTNLTNQKVTTFGYKPIKKNNMQVIYCSTAANLFHAYRRQLRRDYRKPLINIVNKRLLKLKDSASTLKDFNQKRFITIYNENNININPKNVKKVILLAGQAYYSVLEKRKQLQRWDIAIIRIQEIAPFHYSKFKEIIQEYSNCKDYVWYQEQHRNSGPWGYLAPRIQFSLDTLKNQQKIPSYNLSCVSRRNSSAPSVGYKKKHDQESVQILNQLFR